MHTLGVNIKRLSGPEERCKEHDDETFFGFHLAELSILRSCQTFITRLAGDMIVLSVL